MTQQEEEGQDGEQGMRRQFKLLQEEMRRSMAEPRTSEAAAAPDIGPSAEEEAQFRRIEAWFEELRRNTGQTGASAPRTADTPASNEAIAALSARTDAITQQVAEIGQRAGATDARLTRALQGNREAIEALAIRLDAQARRRSSRFLVPAAILVGALAIAWAMVLSVPGRPHRLIDRFNAIVFPPKPQAETVTAPPPVPQPPPPPEPAKAAAAAPPPPAPAPPSPAPPPPAPSPPTPPTPAVSLPPSVTPPSTTADAPAPPPAPAPSVPPAPASPAPTADLPKNVTPPSTAADPPASPPTAAPEVPATPPPATPPPATPPPATPPPAAPPTTAAAADPPAPHARIVLRAKADTWVDVRGHEGSALISRVLHAGESWQVPDQPALFLSTGNAGGLDLLVDGKPAPAIGPSGAIRHDLPLDAGRIRDGRYPTEPPARAKHPPPGK